MRRDEIEVSSAAEQRVKRLKDNAATARNRAKQLKAQAETGAEQLRVRQSREKLARIRKAGATSMIKPYH